MNYMLQDAGAVCGALGRGVLAFAASPPRALLLFAPLDVCPGSSVLAPSIRGQAPLSGISRPIFQFVVVLLPLNSAQGGQGCQPGAQCSNRIGVPQQPRSVLLFGPVPAPPLPSPPLPRPAPPRPRPSPLSCPCSPSQLAQHSSGHFLPTAPSPGTLLPWLLPCPFSSCNPCSPCQAGVWLEGGQPGGSQGSPLAQDTHLGNLDDNPPSGPQGQELWSAGGLCGHHPHTSQRQRWGQGEGWDSLP